MSDLLMESLPDHAGERYIAVLSRLHRALPVNNYFEIGTNTGESLRLSKCRTVAVDPKFIFNSPEPVSGKPLCAL